MFSHKYASKNGLFTNLETETNSMKNMVATTMATAVTSATIANNAQNERFNVLKPQNDIISHTLYTYPSIISSNIIQSTTPMISQTWPWLVFNFD